MHPAPNERNSLHRSLPAVGRPALSAGEGGIAFAPPFPDQRPVQVGPAPRRRPPRGGRPPAPTAPARENRPMQRWLLGVVAVLMGLVGQPAWATCGLKLAPGGHTMTVGAQCSMAELEPMVAMVREAAPKAHLPPPRRERDTVSVHDFDSRSQAKLRKVADIAQADKELRRREAGREPNQRKGAGWSAQEMQQVESH